jgi:glutamyl-tRNA synthetase
LHIGGLRTALFNYLFARQHHGSFILRIEDTDQTRLVPGAEEYIIKSLEWAGIVPDEGLSYGGNFGPYRQSDRKQIYRQYAELLINSGDAYYAFDTPEELENIRREYEGRKETFFYNSVTRSALNNSLSLKDSELKDRLESGIPYVIRFKFNSGEEIIMQDIIRGEVRIQTSTLDDKVLFKSDGMPTYHLANVTDDYLMKITHVIRGEEWLPSLPLHIALYRALGWEKEMPQFAHLPLILKPDGKGKLSKRDGDKGGFPVFPLNWKDPDTGEISKGYRESGYLPEACLNILAFLGWNPGTEQELFSLQELIEAFSLEKTGKAGARFDPEKAKWYNHQYLQKKPDHEIANEFKDILLQKGINPIELPGLIRIIGLVKERASFVYEIWDHAGFFFKRPATYDKETVKKRWNQDLSLEIKELSGFLEKENDFTAENLEKSLKKIIEDRGLNAGQIMNGLRLCLVGELKGPGIFDIMNILGRDETVARIGKALDELPSG